MQVFIKSYNVYIMVGVIIFIHACTCNVVDDLFPRDILSYIMVIINFMFFPAASLSIV
jgi:hypothetical protein